MISHHHLCHSPTLAAAILSPTPKQDSLKHLALYLITASSHALAVQNALYSQQHSTWQLHDAVGAQSRRHIRYLSALSVITSKETHPLFWCRSLTTFQSYFQIHPAFRSTPSFSDIHLLLITHISILFLIQVPGAPHLDCHARPPPRHRIRSGHARDPRRRHPAQRQPGRLLAGLSRR